MNRSLTASAPLGVAALCAAAAVWIAPTTAHAYKRTMTCTESGIFACGPNQTPKPVYWFRRDLTYQINQEGSEDFASGANGMISEELQQAIRDSFSPWSDLECTDVTIADEGLTDIDAINYDSDGSNFNLLVWKESWPYPVSGSSAYALTSVTYDTGTGELADADIEFNGETFEWTNAETAADTIVDVRNTLTHEAGHFIGLDHSLDHEATMFAQAPTGEIKKRTLEQDDIDGFCATYPLDDDGDGYNSIDEDLNENGYLGDDDTDDDGTPNFLDPDDDGDGIPTIEEPGEHLTPEGEEEDDDGCAAVGAAHRPAPAPLTAALLAMCLGLLTAARRRR